MKKLTLLLCTAICICLLQACGGGAAKNDAQAKADNVNGKKDTAAGAAAMAVNKDDAGFATEAASGGLEEVELGKIAQAKATNPQVKAFAAQMITDHSKANAELMKVSKAENITLPAVPGEKQQKIMADLSKKTGKDFDKAYVDAMVDDHKDDVKKFTDAIKNVKDADLNMFATKTLPVLQMHLDMITKIHDSMK